MSPEEYAQNIVARITLQPQGQWDADVVEFETKHMGVTEFQALIAYAIREAVSLEREACARLADTGGPDAPWNGRDQHELDNLAFCARRIAAAIRARGEAS